MNIHVVGTWEIVHHRQCADPGVDLFAWDVPDKYVIDRQTVKNALVDSGIDLILRRAFEGNALALPTTIQLGTSAAAFSRTQTGCQAAIVANGLEEATATLALFARLTGGSFIDRATMSKTFAASGAAHDVTEFCVRSVTPRCINRTLASQHVDDGANLTVTYNLDINTT